MAKKTTKPKKKVHEDPEVIPTTTSQPTIQLATLDEIAKKLKLTALQVRKLAQSGQIPAVKVEGEWRFNTDLVFEAIHRRSRRM
jgi:excisionase family DNA binding protein